MTSAVATRDVVLERYEPANYLFRALESEEEFAAFDELLESRYGPLNFLRTAEKKAFLPREGTTRYGLFFGNELVGICALNPVDKKGSVFHKYIPVSRIAERRLVEINNVVLCRRFTGLGCATILLYEAVKAAMRAGYDMTVGITRYQTLKFFIESGAVPVDHPPLHLLGRPDLLDFIVYYDLSPQGVEYLHYHIPRAIRHEMIYEKIKRSYVKPRLRAAEGV